MKSVDYSLYLVTDSTPAVLGDADLFDVVDAALRGGVTLVQYRDKCSDTGHQVEIARRLHVITKKYNVPLLINDRVDVALAVGCEGVHIGQDDLGTIPCSALLCSQCGLRNLALNLTNRSQDCSPAIRRFCHHRCHSRIRRASLEGL